MSKEHRHGPGAPRLQAPEGPAAPAASLALGYVSPNQDEAASTGHLAFKIGERLARIIKSPALVPPPQPSRSNEPQTNISRGAHHASADVRVLPQPTFKLQFPSFCAVGYRLVFALDAGGVVLLDALGERALNYLFMRALLGHDYGWPTVAASHRRS